MFLPVKTVLQRLAYNMQEAVRQQSYGRKDYIMEFENLTEEQKAKIRACETPEELVQLAMDEDVELSDEQLDAVSGGWAGDCGEVSYVNDSYDYRDYG